MWCNIIDTIVKLAFLTYWWAEAGIKYKNYSTVEKKRSLLDAPWNESLNAESIDVRAESPMSTRAVWWEDEMRREVGKGMRIEAPSSWKDVWSQLVMENEAAKGKCAAANEGNALCLQLASVESHRDARSSHSFAISGAKEYIKL